MLIGAVNCFFFTPASLGNLREQAPFNRSHWHARIKKRFATLPSLSGTDQPPHKAKLNYSKSGSTFLFLAAGQRAKKLLTQAIH
ncbi:hypothetical protein [Zymobacter palmae]|uniref:hypothetical protein n=1 Tax=Zymobacter palmae TaxID=33074 RepID=UPI000485005D|nr:hypothetical protein [Zymobacter palmae]